jgi:hypothetical protein
MVAAPHPEDHRRPAGNRGDLSERGRCCGTAARAMGTGIAGRRPTASNSHGSWVRAARRKTGHRGDHRLWRGLGHSGAFLRSRSGCRWRYHHRGDRLRQLGRRRPGRRKTGHRGDHRPWRGFGRANGGVADVGQRLRRPSRRHRTGALPWPQRHGDLAGPGRHPRLHGRLPERQALRAQAGRQPFQRSLRSDRYCGRRRGPGRLRHRSHGPRPAQRQVPPGCPQGPLVRDDARLQPQVGPPPGVPLQHADLGRVA